MRLRIIIILGIKMTSEHHLLILLILVAKVSHILVQQSGTLFPQSSKKSTLLKASKK